MRLITIRLLLAIAGGALLWEGVRSGVSGNLYALILIGVGGYLIYKSRFFG